MTRILALAISFLLVGQSTATTKTEATDWPVIVSTQISRVNLIQITGPGGHSELSMPMPKFTRDAKIYTITAQFDWNCQPVGGTSKEVTITCIKADAGAGK